MSPPTTIPVRTATVAEKGRSRLMIRGNYHTHCSFCDGTGEPEAFVLEAIRQGMNPLGFSSHAPLPFPNNFAMKERQLPDYLRTVRAIRDKYRDSIRILVGLEVDFVPGIEEYQAGLFSLGLDFTIGSVHYVDQTDQGVPWPVDADPERFDRGIAEFPWECPDCRGTILRAGAADGGHKSAHHRRTSGRDQKEQYERPALFRRRSLVWQGRG